MGKTQGKIFESDVENSCNDQKIFYFRVRDVFVPPELRLRIRVPKNRYDALIYYKDYLFPLELKSLNSKSISFDEKIIKQHQLDNLEKATSYEGVIPGLILNYRKNDNRAFFIHITDFLDYKYIAENEIENHPYKNKVNRKSIPIKIAEEIGIEIPNEQKRTRYKYDVSEMASKAIEKYSN